MGVMVSPAAPVLIVAGEASGDMYGAELVADLVSKLGVNAPGFFGCGGQQMRQAGVETLVDIHSLAVLGPLEAVSHLFDFYAALRLLSHTAIVRQSQVAILIDFPDFNLRLARKLKAHGIRVIYLISPQVWAWRSGRIKKIKSLVDQMLVILPFEKEFYAAKGVSVHYVGHPLVDKVRTTRPREKFLETYHLDPSTAIVSLLPGSRTKEIRFHLPVLLETAQRLSWSRPIQFLLPIASERHQTLVRQLISERTPDAKLRVIANDTYDAVACSDLAVVASGTATLETALLGTPFITIFRISDLTWIIGQYLVRVPFYSLVNLIAGKEIVLELFQKDFTVERLYDEVLRHLDNGALLKRVRMDLASVRRQLGAGGAIHNAAQRLLPWLNA
jgi:lipid-A-disaccharide synthase